MLKNTLTRFPILAKKIKKSIYQLITLAKINFNLTKQNFT